MMNSIAQASESAYRRTFAMYSDRLGCVLWFLRSAHYIACRVNGSGDVAIGATGDFFNGDNDWREFTAVARLPNWLSSTSSIRNILFTGARVATNTFVATAYEDYSGFDGRTVPELSAYQFTLPMMPYAVDEDGRVLPTRLTGFRLIGEVHRDVRTTLVRTNVDWNTEPLIRDKSGTRLQSRDGWVPLPETYLGKYHSLSFRIYDATEETTYLRRPYFSAVEVTYEAGPSRGA
jgi:hypothetical protein